MLFDVIDQSGVSKLPTLKNRLYLALLKDVDVDNFPQAVNATISTNVLLPNKVYRFVDAQTNSIKPNATPGESPYTGKIVLTPILEGLSRTTLDFLYKNVGERVVAVWERCSDGQKFLAGSPCSGGLVVKFTSVGNLDGGVAGVALSLEGGDCPEPFWFYDGPIPRQAPQIVNIVPPDTTFAIGEASEYLLGDNTAALTLTDITGVTAADVGRIVELQGGGVNFPTAIQPSAVFVLQNGIPFSATVGNKISFVVQKTGSSSYAFYEVSRA
jgi:hypothetical protein